MSNVMDNVTKALKHASEGNAQFQKAAQILSGGPSSFYFDKIQEYVAALFGRFAPFQVGDRVKLTAAPNTDNDWRHSAHFLIPGAVGTVQSVDYSRDQFVADVVFDDESWIKNGVACPVDSKHTYRIEERILNRCTPLREIA